MIHYLQIVGFPDRGTWRRKSPLSASARPAGLCCCLPLPLALVLLIAGRIFFRAARQAGRGAARAFLIFDLGRADLPYIIHWDYKQKYEVGSLNPIVKFSDGQTLRTSRRRPAVPRTEQGLQLFDELYRIEWMQHHFPYYNIQCLDIVQMPRMPEDLKAYLKALSPDGTAATAPLIARQWELTNTRYLLGPAGFLDVMNQQLDPVQHRFRIVQRFDVVPKPGITPANPTGRTHRRSRRYTAIMRCLNSPARCPARNFIPTGRSTPTTRPS